MAFETYSEALDFIKQTLDELGLSTFDVTLVDGKFKPRITLSLSASLDDYDVSNMSNLEQFMLPIIDSIVDSPLVQREIQPLQREVSELRAEVARLKLNLEDAVNYKTFYALQYQMQHGKTIE